MCVISAAGAVHPRVCGNTLCDLILVGPDSVHPRVCGEHISFLHLVQEMGGSSPRVRGTLFQIFRTTLGLRFIPACAGNTIMKVTISHVSPVHPRVCGNTITLSKRDSSVTVHPRVCGEHCIWPEVKRIPACAGNTLKLVPPVVSIPVHPRVCGEHKFLLTDHSNGDGSSPRVRGTP